MNSSGLQSGSTELSPQWNQQSKNTKTIPILQNKKKRIADPFLRMYQILKKKKDNPEADVGELEREIDLLVYKLYNLTEGEIGIIENK